MIMIIITIMVIIIPSIVGSNALLGCGPHRSNLIFPTQHLFMSERPLAPLWDRSKEVLPGEAFEYAGQGRMKQSCNFLCNFQGCDTDALGLY